MTFHLKINYVFLSQRTNVLNKFRGTKVSMGFKISQLVYGCLLGKGCGRLGKS